MSSQRWSTMPGFRQLRAIRSAAAVVVLGAFVAAMIVTAHGTAGLRVQAASRQTSLDPLAGRHQSAPATRRSPAVSDALQVFGERLASGDPASARASRSLLRLPFHQWVRPYGGYLSSTFGMRWGRLHAGIDLAGPWGTSMYAATDGCVEYAGPEAGYGEVMKIRDWDGTETWYGHMSSFIVRHGCVHAGDPIAHIGSGGDATGPHLHFEVRINGTPIDPIPFMAKRGVYI
jgi:murein DD-endopeptidase MepM/ murein hydrolase activator NlpD